MKIQAEVSLYVQLADGRRVSVSHTVNRTAGDNPAYAAGEALEALTEAQTAALRGFAAQIGQHAPEHDALRLASNIRNARKGPER